MKQFARRRGRRARAGADAGRAALHLCRADRHDCRAGHDRAVPLGPRAGRSASSGTARRTTVDAEEAARDRACLRLPAAAGGAASASSTGSPTTRCRRPAWCCAWCCARRRRSSRSSRSTGVRLAGPPPERMTPARAARARARRRRARLDESGLAARGRRVVRRHRRAASRRARSSRSRSPPRPIAADARSGPCAAGPVAGAGGGGRGAARGRRATASPSRCSTASPARARPRSISRRSPRRCDAGRQALILLPEIALTGAFLDRFARPLRRAARPNGIPTSAPRHARARLARRSRDGEVRVGGRRALGAVPAVPRARPDRRRRGARPRLQAGGRRLLPRARHGGGARASRRLPGRAGLGDAVGREPRQRRSRPLPRSSCCPARFADAALPDIARDRHARSTRRSAARCLSPPLARGGRARRSARGEQALLFLNRRGYAPLTLCRACGHRFQCPNCSAWLVEHRFRGKLVCHHCGHEERRPEACPNCGAVDTPGRLRPGRRAHRRGGASSAFPTRARSSCRPTCWAACSGCALELEAIAQRRGRHRHRHAARRQGPQFPRPDAGRRGRCRSRPRHMAIRAPPSAPSSS